MENLILRAMTFSHGIVRGMRDHVVYRQGFQRNEVPWAWNFLKRIQKRKKDGMKNKASVPSEFFWSFFSCSNFDFSRNDKDF